jgi:hypothetical protein
MPDYSRILLGSVICDYKLRRAGGAMFFGSSLDDFSNQICNKRFIFPE